MIINVATSLGLLGLMAGALLMFADHSGFASRLLNYSYLVIVFAWILYLADYFRNEK